MGRRRKKPFINKNEAQTYRLVPRSHNDPKAGDVDESQYVLKPEQELDVDEHQEHQEEPTTEKQKKFGIYFEDDYDYLQHMKAPGTAVLEPVGLGPTENDETATRRQGQASLPEELFGQEVDVGGLDKVLPVSGPRPDWDHEIVEALENAELSSDLDQQLEDDFVMLANSGEAGLEQPNNPSDDPYWWKGRGDFEHSQPPERSREPGDTQSGSDAEESGSISSGRNSTLGSMNGAYHRSEKKTARFTEYSTSSSVIPRSEALTLLDDKFEEFMAEYNDELLGAGEEEGDRGVAEGVCLDPSQLENDRMLLQTAVEDFEKNFKDETTHVGDMDRGRPRYEVENDCEGTESEDEEDTASRDGATRATGATGSSGSVGEEEERDIIEIDTTPKLEKWDCETILSTCSTLYNHPTRISEPRTARASKESDGEIKLSNKTGMPLGVINGPLPKENHPSRGTITRPRNESKEEKKARKESIKEDRKQRRADKKATKLVFKAEATKQEIILNSTTRVSAVV